MASSAPRIAQSASGAPKMNTGSSGLGNVIDRSDFMPGAARMPSADDNAKSPWFPEQLRPVPAFYPLEKSSRLVDNSPQDVASRLAECLRLLSVHAVYDNQAATASLETSEHVEMHLSLWRTPIGAAPGVLVELQRRKGDSIAFHRYSRYILDAAVGDWDPKAIHAEWMDDLLHSKQVQRLLQMELSNRDQQEHENAIVAIEIAHGLLMKDRMDARQLGLESLCLLTDPRKTGYLTALLTSHVVLLGTTQGVQIPGVTESDESQLLMDESPFQEIRETILSLIQFRRIGEDSELEEDNPVDSEHLTAMHNLALAVLANALDVIEHPERFDAEPEDTKPRARLRTASSNEVTNDFLQQSEETTQHELLKTLISELGNASQRPHNAHLSAKCIGSLCRASEEAQRRAKELGAKNVVSTALEVGVRTHAKLETECQKVVAALEASREETQQQPLRNLREEDSDDEDEAGNAGSRNASGAARRG
jgi:hypothetical protein